MTLQTYEPPPRAEVALANYQDVAIQRLGEWARSAEAAHHIAETLVRTSFCPDQFRGKPGEATAAILAGMEVGLQPMAALRSFDVINNTAAARAITLRAVVQGQGHEMVLVESTSERCKMKGRRRGTAEWSTVTWTMDRARQLGLANKNNWKSQPTAMLLARATAELARLIASDAILGIPYSAEEVADGGAFDQQVDVETTTPAAPSGTRRMGRNLRPVEEPAERIDSPAASGVEDSGGGSPSPDPSPEPDDDTEGITAAQLRNIGRLCGELGLTDRAAALAYVNDVIGREVSSRNELSKDEASRVIDAMAADADAARGADS